MSRKRTAIAAAIAALCTVACSESNALEAPQTVSIMAFNVQNLFDNIDDPGKDDKAYLAIEAKQDPLHIDECNAIPVESWRNECLYLDWNDAAVEHKLAVVAEAIRQVDDGRGPDIIALQEVENIGILERLRNDYLADSGYEPALLIEGQDLRGIDVAFLSRLPLAAPAKLHAFELPGEFAEYQKDTRGLIEATFELPDGGLLTGFSVHFPAPHQPTPMRVLAYEHLANVKEGVPEGSYVFAAGDFNTTSRENAAERMLEKHLGAEWQISNDYCEGCPGNYYYSRDDTWSFMDMVIFAAPQNVDGGWQIQSVEIANQYAAQVTEDGTPHRYRSEERTGVSDHWPVVMTLEKRP